MWYINHINIKNRPERKTWNTWKKNDLTRPRNNNLLLFWYFDFYSCLQTFCMQCIHNKSGCACLDMHTRSVHPFSIFLGASVALTSFLVMWLYFVCFFSTVMFFYENNWLEGKRQQSNNHEQKLSVLKPLFAKSDVMM